MIKVTKAKKCTIHFCRLVFSRSFDSTLYRYTAMTAWADRMVVGGNLFCLFTSAVNGSRAAGYSDVSKAELVALFTLQ
jgi:hypothetical protein